VVSPFESGNIQVSEKRKGSVYLRKKKQKAKSGIDLYLEALDDVDDYMRYLRRVKYWKKQAKRFRRREKVHFD